MTTYYKVLGTNGESCHGGSGKWYLPNGKRPGKWMPKIKGTIKCCERGYHLVTASQLVEYLGPTIWVAEGKGDTDVQDDKTAFRQARLLSRVTTWDERMARIFACDCAERVLHIYEKAYPDDKRPRTAVEVAKRYAEGKATDEERVAARAAVRDAVGDAVKAAAKATAKAAVRAAFRAAWATAWDAAEAAALTTDEAAWASEDVTRDAARIATKNAERQWQSEHLCELLGIRPEILPI